MVSKNEEAKGKNKLQNINKNSFFFRFLLSLHLNQMNLNNIPEFTVSEFSRSIKRVVEDSFGYVRIKGEITGFKRASSGHLYFTLKDENSTLTAVLFRNASQLVKFEMADGLQVCASGKITTYEGRSNYQIIVEKIEIAGIGAVLEMIEKRRQKLLAEGLFDEVHKKPIPFFPKIIGVITSETGAVIQDIKHRIEARCPTHIMLYPSLVQGEKAAMEIIAGIKFFNRLKKEERPDVLIIARGGGSFEDLMPFNDENLIREIFKSEIPLISAVGHETDTTLIDYVSDLRAPTPTAAAELATPILSDLKNQVNFYSEKLKFLPKNFLEQNFQHLKNLQRYILDPAKMLDQINDKFFQIGKKFNFLVQNFFEKKTQKVLSMQISSDLLLQKINLANHKMQFAFERLNSRSESYFKTTKTSLENLTKLLKSNHYNEILKRGFALIKNKNGSLISSISDVKIAQEILIEMHDGQVQINKTNS
jgi:exodeoxyribonuclease VII large subunit